MCKEVLSINSIWSSNENVQTRLKLLLWYTEHDQRHWYFQMQIETCDVAE